MGYKIVNKHGVAYPIDLPTRRVFMSAKGVVKLVGVEYESAEVKSLVDRGYVAVVLDELEVFKQEKIRGRVVTIEVPSVAETVAKEGVSPGSPVPSPKPEKPRYPGFTGPEVKREGRLERTRELEKVDKPVRKKASNRKKVAEAEIEKVDGFEVSHVKERKEIVVSEETQTKGRSRR